MRLIKGKAYEIENRVYVYNGEGLIDCRGAYLENYPKDIKEIEPNDNLYKYRTLLRDVYLRVNGQPFEVPKDETIVKVYYNENEIYYGIVRNGEIITTANKEIKCKHVAFEKTNVNKDQKKILLEIYQQEEKTDMLRKELADIRKKLDDSSEEKEELCKKARVLAGTLMFNEFIEKFEEYLNPEVKRLMDLYGYRTKRNSTIPLAYNEIIIARTAILEELNYDDIVEEYGNTFSTGQDEKALNIQAEYKEKYSKPLPTKWPLKQKLHFGINGTLCLTEGYILKVEGLSEEGAKKIAEEFNVCSKPTKKTNEY